MDFDTAQLYVPLMDFVVRAQIFPTMYLDALDELIINAGMEKEELEIVQNFLTKLRKLNE